MQGAITVDDEDIHIFGALRAKKRGIQTLFSKVSCESFIHDAAC
jgi:hypothetical protein